MFSGIVEIEVPVRRARPENELVRLELPRPALWQDIELGHSIAVNGVCLTIEKLDAETMGFAIGLETLQVTGWQVDILASQHLNIERPLRLGDRLHGHLVTGHVDGIGLIREIQDQPEGRTLTISCPETLQSLVWPKGSITVQGVSLTVNKILLNSFTVGLIPETLKRTNLHRLKLNDRVNLEGDWLAKATHRWLAQKEERPLWS